MQQFLALALTLRLRPAGTFDVRASPAVPSLEERDAGPDVDGFFVAAGEIAIEPGQEELRTLTRGEAEELLPELAEGSMRPKVEAALSFGGETLITNFEGLESGGGTRIA